MAEILTPPLGTTGLFTLSAPFDTELLAGVQYTVISIRTIADLNASGIDPMKSYYTPHGLTAAQYQTDVANGVMILTLQATDGTVVRVPNTYITTFPATGGIPYKVIALAITLGAVPDTLDLTAIKTLIQSNVQDTVGVQAAVQEIALCSTVLIENDTAARYEAAREQTITNSTTLTAKLLAAQNQLASAQNKIALLEAYIKANIKTV